MKKTWKLTYMGQKSVQPGKDDMMIFDHWVDARYRREDREGITPEGIWICNDELRAWFDIPEDVKNITLVYTSKETKDSYYYKRAPGSYWDITESNGYVASQFMADSTVDALPDEGYLRVEFKA